MVNGRHLHSTSQHLHGTSKLFTVASHSLTHSYTKKYWYEIFEDVEHTYFSLFSPILIYYLWGSWLYLHRAKLSGENQSLRTHLRVAVNYSTFRSFILTLVQTSAEEDQSRLRPGFFSRRGAAASELQPQLERKIKPLFFNMSCGAAFRRNFSLCFPLSTSLSRLCKMSRNAKWKLHAKSKNGQLRLNWFALRIAVRGQNLQTQ